MLYEVITSMDGRGRVQDNIFIERLWWTLKYQYLYLWSFGNGTELRKGLCQWFGFYNAERFHQALDNLTVITSYSIHYTKLYDLMASDNISIFSASIFFLLFFNFYMAVFNQTVLYLNVFFYNPYARLAYFGSYFLNRNNFV